MNNSIKGAIYGCISAVSYAMNPLCAVCLYEDDINSNSVLFYRFGIGSIVLGLFMWVKRMDFGVTYRESCILSLLGLIFAISSLTYFLSFYYMGPGVAATLVFAYPVFVAVLMALFFKERLKWPSIIAILLTVCGIAMLYEGDNGQPIAPMGIVLVLISALTYALYIITINRSGIVMSGTKLTFYAMLSCMGCIVLYSILTPTGSLQLLHTGREWFFAVLLGIVPTVISLVFMTMAIHCIGSTRTAIMGALEPVTAVFVGVLLFDELLTGRLVIGITLILVSVMLILLDSRIRAFLGENKVVRKGQLILKRARWK